MLLDIAFILWNELYIPREVDDCSYDIHTNVAIAGMCCKVNN